ncbi:MAG: hypothetical protein LRZ85_09245 [Alphaproteobacteria bacterium]|nr:hypothetical protein [Alphaproteobacteria bacterium]
MAVFNLFKSATNEADPMTQALEKSQPITDFIKSLRGVNNLTDFFQLHGFEKCAVYPPGEFGEKTLFAVGVNTGNAYQDAFRFAHFDVERDGSRSVAVSMNNYMSGGKNYRERSGTDGSNLMINMIADWAIEVQPAKEKQIIQLRDKALAQIQATPAVTDDLRLDTI